MSSIGRSIAKLILLGCTCNSKDFLAGISRIHTLLGLPVLRWFPFGLDKLNEHIIPQTNIGLKKNDTLFFDFDIMVYVYNITK